jgi:hypothetical protein
LLTRGSHRSGRAQFGHPAPRSKRSLRTEKKCAPWVRRRRSLPGAHPAQSASPCRCVKMLARPKVRDICPARGSSDRSAASLPRVLWGEFPALDGTISRLRLLIRHPAALRCLRLAVPCVVPCSLPPPGHRCGGPGLLLSRRPHRVSRREHMSPPRFLDDPCVHAPLSDPGGVPKPGLYSSGSTAFRLHNDVGTATQLSRLYHAACTPPVYASQAGSPPHHATLGSGGWPILSGSGLSPAGSLREFPMDSRPARSHHPPPPGFAWRNMYTFQSRCGEWGTDNGEWRVADRVL